MWLIILVVSLVYGLFSKTDFVIQFSLEALGFVFASFLFIVVTTVTTATVLGVALEDDFSRTESRDSYEAALEIAEKFAIEGNVEVMKAHLGHARTWAEKALIRVNRDRVSGIQKMGYSAGYRAELESAERHAKEGNAEAMRASIDRARTYASISNIEVHEARIAKNLEINQKINQTEQYNLIEI